MASVLRKRLNKAAIAAVVAVVCAIVAVPAVSWAVVSYNDAVKEGDRSLFSNIGAGKEWVVFEHGVVLNEESYQDMDGNRSIRVDADDYATVWYNFTDLKYLNAYVAFNYTIADAFAALDNDVSFSIWVDKSANLNSLASEVYNVQFEWGAWSEGWNGSDFEHHLGTATLYNACVVYGESCCVRETWFNAEFDVDAWLAGVGQAWADGGQGGYNNSEWHLIMGVYKLVSSDNAKSGEAEVRWKLAVSEAYGDLVIDETTATVSGIAIMGLILAVCAFVIWKFMDYVRHKVAKKQRRKSNVRHSPMLVSRR